MTTPAARVTAWAGLAVAALGVLIGLMPLTAGGVACGSALHGASVLDIGAGDTWTRCTDKRSTLKVIVVPLLILGVGAAGVGGFVAASRRERDRQAAEL